MQYLSMDMERKDVIRVLAEIEADPNIRDGEVLDWCHDEIQVAQTFETRFTVGEFFTQIR